jgi:hypothetical protein
VLCVAGTAGALVVVVLLRPGDAAGPCAVAQRALLQETPEASGLAISRRTPGVVWTHNDSGHKTDLFAVDVTGAPRGRVRVPVVTRDWEDISAGRCGIGDCLYIADIGDNRLARDRIRIYRVPEPAPGDAETSTPAVLTATYADGPHNAEALFVIGEDLFIVTRDRGALYRSRRASAESLDLTFERIAELGLAPVSDAEATPDEASVVVRTMKLVVVYRTADIIRGGAVPEVLRIPLEGLKEPQGEGVALDSAGMLYLASEGRPWNRAGRFVSLRCSLP